MKISTILQKNDSGISFEFFPPKTDKGKMNLKDKARALKVYNPLYVSMTYGAGGVNQSHTKESVYMLLKEKGLVVMPHLTCIGAGKDSIKTLLSEYKEKDVKNIMALRGDIPSGAEQTGNSDFCYAKDLVSFIKRQGDFCVGVAVYPQGHIESPSLEKDMEYTRQKIDAGADFAVTQMFFDNTYYYSFLDRMEKNGINIPVLPGILPLTNIEKVKEFASICRATIPKSIEEELMRFKDNPAEMELAGIDLTVKQCRDLLNHGIKRFHFFTLNRKEVMAQLLEMIIP